MSFKIIAKNNGYRIYVEIMTGEKLFIGQLVHPVGGIGDGVNGVDC